MTALIVELPPKLYARLRAEAERQGKPPEGIAQEWLTERLVSRGTRPASPPVDREQVQAALRAAGLLVEPTPEQRAQVEAHNVTLADDSDLIAAARAEGLAADDPHLHR